MCLSFLEPKSAFFHATLLVFYSSNQFGMSVISSSWPVRNHWIRKHWWNVAIKKASVSKKLTPPWPCREIRHRPEEPPTSGGETLPEPSPQHLHALPVSLPGQNQVRLPMILRGSADPSEVCPCGPPLERRCTESVPPCGFRTWPSRAPPPVSVPTRISEETTVGNKSVPGRSWEAIWLSVNVSFHPEFLIFEPYLFCSGELWWFEQRRHLSGIQSDWQQWRRWVCLCGWGDVSPRQPWLTSNTKLMKAVCCCCR